MVDFKKLEEKVNKFPVLAEWDKTGLKYVDAPEVKMIADSLIPLYHQDIENASIAYVFKEKNTKKPNGSIVWATMQKTTDKMRYFKPYDFIMVVGYAQWVLLSAREKIALVDHELCHAGFTIENGFYIVNHTVEEFRAIIDRHGFWTDGLQGFGDACKKVKGKE
jgi:predicted metallopeptidase